PVLLASLIAPVSIMLLLCLVISAMLIYWQKKIPSKKTSAGVPVNFTSVILSALFIALMLVIIAMAKRYFGISGIQFIAFIGGLFELHAITLATTLLYLDNNINITQTTQILSYALVAAFIS